MGNYFPTSGQDQRAWIVQFLAQLNNYSTTLGVSAAEVTELTNTGGAATGAIDNFVAKSNDFDSALASRVQSVEEFSATLRPIVRRMKSSAAYTPTIGEALGIVAADQPIDPAQIKPSVVATVNMGFVRLRVRRYGADNVAVFCRCAGETEWRLLGRATRAVFDDTVPLRTPGVPEIREYIVQGYIGDTQVGMPSDPNVAVFAGAIAA